MLSQSLFTCSVECDQRRFRIVPFSDDGYDMVDGMVVLLDWDGDIEGLKEGVDWWNYSDIDDH